MTTETIHTDYETIERPTQDYRISTKVMYVVEQKQYKCRARLYKSHGGRIHNARRDKLFGKSLYVEHKQSIETALETCIEQCREKMDELEDAKDVSIEVTVSDE